MSAYMRSRAAGAPPFSVCESPIGHPVFAADERRRVPGSRVEGVSERAQHGGALGRRGSAPWALVQGPTGGANGCVDVGLAPERGHADALAGGSLDLVPEFCRAPGRSRCRR